MTTATTMATALTTTEATTTNTNTNANTTNNCDNSNNSDSNNKGGEYRPKQTEGGAELAFSRPWPISHGVACPTSSVPSTAKAEFMPNLEQPSMHAYINVHSTNTSYTYKSPRAIFQGIEVVWKHHPHVIVVILKSTVIVSSITIIIIIIIVNLVILIIAITIISMLLSRS